MAGLLEIVAASSRRLGEVARPRIQRLAVGTLSTVKDRQNVLLGRRVRTDVVKKGE